MHYHSAKFFNFNYQPNAWQTLRPTTNIYKLKLWRYYIKESLCTGPVYDLDLIAIGNLNGARINSSNTDEFWYPVPVKNAGDYYEQLDEIVPSQYEVLLKQIMRKYKLGEGVCLAQSSPQQQQQPASSPNGLPPSFPGSTLSHATTTLLNNILLNSNPNHNNTSHSPGSNGPNGQLVQLNWKNVWDYFYQLVSISYSGNLQKYSF